MKKWTYVLPFFIVLFWSVTSYSVTVDDVKPYIEQHYYEDVNDQIYDQSIDDLMNELDPYSQYMTEEEFNTFQNSINQEFVGIGIMMEFTDQGALITQVFPNSPASDKGLQPGDLMIQVDQQSLSDLSQEQITQLLAGEDGTDVTVTIERDTRTLTKTITRQPIEIPTVQSDLLAGDIGYLSINSFSDDMIDEVHSEMSHLTAKSWIVDLRNNSGGYVSSAQHLLGMFPTIAYALEVHLQDGIEMYHPVAQPNVFPVESSLLVNQYSASASEIVAAAIKDYDAADIYGETTFGKGLMQRSFQLNSGGVLNLSVAEFKSPHSQTIHQTGVEPSIQSSSPLKDSHWDTYRDQHDYKTFDDIKTIETDHEFTITLNDDANIESLDQHIDLISLGGQSMDYDLTRAQDHAYTLDPHEPFNHSQHVAVIVHPGWTNQSGQTAEQGVMVRAYVKSK
ncbi:carboxyl-terminal processing protease [Alkalibacillus flavidus]|uniref:Carboxyl-terminal processing protease n=1 Tax=Alkalibacillus flavidus TaxID=546021 RepID=A0ABV2KTV3_9BACI